MTILWVYVLVQKWRRKEIQSERARTQNLTWMGEGLEFCSNYFFWPKVLKNIYIIYPCKKATKL